MFFWNAGKASNFQSRVRRWIVECMGEEIADDQTERCYRFFEEAAELVQSLGMTKEECFHLVNYVYGRPIGDPQQESGGVSVTHMALGCAFGIDVEAEAWIELNRIKEPETMRKIREKQAKKPRFLGT